MRHIHAAGVQEQTVIHLCCHEENRLYHPTLALAESNGPQM